MTRRSKTIGVVFTSVLLGLGVLYVLESSRRPRNVTSIVSISSDIITSGERISYEDALRTRLIQLQGGTSASDVLQEFGIQLGPTIGLDDYTAELLAYQTEYLANDLTADYVPLLNSRLSLKPPLKPLPNRPKQVVSTDKSLEAVSEEFDRWGDWMPDWTIEMYDDEALVWWVERLFGGTKAETIWKSLPRTVLKTDLFRYMMMLIEGGIYTDSDTVPLIHPDEWGKPYDEGTDLELTRLTDAWTQELGISDADGNHRGEPGIIISIEDDYLLQGWKSWKEMTMARGLQIVQWTFMARPGHPIFLDTIGRALRTSERMQEEAEAARLAGTEFVPETALDWTGPGVFTDCVFRYLLNRYGYDPDQLVDLRNPFRVGDVLILPARSFSAIDSDATHDQKKWAAVSHHFLGRWKGEDPGMQAHGWDQW